MHMKFDRDWKKLFLFPIKNFKRDCNNAKLRDKNFVYQSKNVVYTKSVQGAKEQHCHNYLLIFWGGGEGGLKCSYYF
jgi:hypothetical protein